MKNNNKGGDIIMRKKIKDIIKKYGVNLVSLTRNIQGTYEVEIDENVYYKLQEKMEAEIRALGLIDDIFYRDVA